MWEKRTVGGMTPAMCVLQSELADEDLIYYCMQNLGLRAND